MMVLVNPFLHHKNNPKTSQKQSPNDYTKVPSILSIEIMNRLKYSQCVLGKV